MSEPTNDRRVTIRLNYFYPFWNIEKTSKRWNWPVSKAKFDAAEISSKEAQHFAARWREKLFGTAASSTSKEGFVYIPLQGRLLSHRSFQACSPVEMIESLLEYETSRQLIATLHPKERYSKAEKAALVELEQKHPRFRVRTQDMVSLLKGCDYVATQNSSAAFSGYFFRKPAVLFGQINFHHIAANVNELGRSEAIRRAANLNPDFDAYLYWFLQMMSINAGAPNAQEKIALAIKKAGWINT